MTYTSSLSRLADLPDIFRGADITLRFGWTSKTASQYLYLWKQRGLIEALGGHTDVFINQVRQSQPDWDKALLLAWPSAVLTGLEPLRRAGWITQVPVRPEITVRGRAPARVPRFTVRGRSDAWYTRMRAGIQRIRESLPTLRPAWALADMLATHGWRGSGLDPDDLDLSFMIARDRQDWRKAGEVLRLGRYPKDIESLQAESR